MLPAGSERPLVARAALIAQQSGVAELQADDLTNTAWLQACTEKAWSRWAQSADARTVRPARQQLLESVYNTASLAGWLQHQILADPALLPVAKGLLDNPEHPVACYQAIARYLQQWLDSSQPVVSDMHLRVHFNEDATEFTVDQAWLGLCFDGFSSLSEALQQRIRQTLCLLNQWRPVGLPTDYADYFACWHEEDLAAVEQIDDYLESHGLPADYGAIERVIHTLGLDFIDSAEQYHFLKNYAASVRETEALWSEDQTALLPLPELSAQDRRVLAWCDEVNQAVTRHAVVDSEDRGFGLFTPLLLPEIRVLEDDIQMFFEHHMSEPDDEVCLAFTAGAALSEIEEGIKRLAAGNGWLAALLTILEEDDDGAK